MWFLVFDFGLYPLGARIQGGALPVDDRELPRWYLHPRCQNRARPRARTSIATDCRADRHCLGLA
eukprot:3414946-Rhodomonas_salina.2